MMSTRISEAPEPVPTFFLILSALLSRPAKTGLSHSAGLSVDCCPRLCPVVCSLCRWRANVARNGDTARTNARASDESGITRRVAAVYRRLVGLLPAGRGSARGLSAGGLDSAAHTEVLLAALARRAGRCRALRRLGVPERMLRYVPTRRGAWFVAARAMMHRALSKRNCSVTDL